ncbi:MAG: hypothetical protein KAR35_02735 [Candidatus Heimdallarchaeota archaeon]|nr:hypothetical protein [Candidatus Heimdallarchaeota archaeon]MCK5048271.1 hypothetical protein [Candidatus Heimdallarchaeota archaeon]
MVTNLELMLFIGLSISSVTTALFYAFWLRADRAIDGMKRAFAEREAHLRKRMDQVLRDEQNIKYRKEEIRRREKRLRKHEITTYIRSLMLMVYPAIAAVYDLINNGTVKMETGAILFLNFLLYLAASFIGGRGASTGTTALS